ncbi:hypothetical protein CO045_01335 [Candidatus Peregrinibacteria bacterium CG_4_9_14_0_2_um_filter_41_14]|nr:MAG: hypothetical protein COY06_04510 [Candidatus Peregrinibacteria bacterium CG_4_10_14_0_2_um_filter_41_8]PJC38242.1 MAG: hypothetical protein CO045_01335 [Candidatus Peregrinibacteria bacterium CG_4_9_14_0_2_um_filter_41_14]
MPKKIAILCDPIDNQNAGIHVYLKSVVAELKKSTSTNLEYSYIHLKPNRFFDNTSHHIIPDYTFIPGWTTFRKFFLIPRLLKKLKFDAVWEPAHFGPFGLPKKIKRITTIHDLTPILFPQHHPWVSAFLHKLFLKHILHNANLLITVSNHTAKDLAIYAPKTPLKTIVIPLATNLSISPPPPLKQPYFLFVGTVEPRKNLLTLIKAYGRFREQSKQVFQLIIVGALGWKFQPLLQLIQNSPFKNDIILTDQISCDRLINYYQMATGFIYPSFYEGFGLPVLEAMTLGTPCIVSNSSSLPEVGGNAVLYFNPHSTKALTAQMLKLIQKQDLQQQLTAAGKTQAKKFSWSKHINQLEDTLVSIFK